MDMIVTYVLYYSNLILSWILEYSNFEADKSVIDMMNMLEYSNFILIYVLEYSNFEVHPPAILRKFTLNICKLSMIIKKMHQIVIYFIIILTLTLINEHS